MQFSFKSEDVILPFIIDVISFGILARNKDIYPYIQKERLICMELRKIVHKTLFSLQNL